MDSAEKNLIIDTTTQGGGGGMPQENSGEEGLLSGDFQQRDQPVISGRSPLPQGQKMQDIYIMD